MTKDQSQNEKHDVIQKEDSTRAEGNVVTDTAPVQQTVSTVINIVTTRPLTTTTTVSPPRNVRAPLTSAMIHNRLSAAARIPLSPRFTKRPSIPPAGRALPGYHTFSRGSAVSVQAAFGRSLDSYDRMDSSPSSYYESSHSPASTVRSYATVRSPIFFPRSATRSRSRRGFSRRGVQAATTNSFQESDNIQRIDGTNDDDFARDMEAAMREWKKNLKFKVLKR